MGMEFILPLPLGYIVRLEGSFNHSPSFISGSLWFCIVMVWGTVGCAFLRVVINLSSLLGSGLAVSNVIKTPLLGFSCLTL